MPKIEDYADQLVSDMADAIREHFFAPKKAGSLRPTLDRLTSLLWRADKFLIRGQKEADKAARAAKKEGAA